MNLIKISGVNLILLFHSNIIVSFSITALSSLYHLYHPSIISVSSLYRLSTIALLSLSSLYHRYIIFPSSLYHPSVIVLSYLYHRSDCNLYITPLSSLLSSRYHFSIIGQIISIIALPSLCPAESSLYHFYIIAGSLLYQYHLFLYHLPIISLSFLSSLL